MREKIFPSYRPGTSAKISRLLLHLKCKYTLKTRVQGPQLTLPPGPLQRRLPRALQAAARYGPGSRDGACCEFIAETKLLNLLFIGRKFDRASGTSGFLECLQVGWAPYGTPSLLPKSVARRNVKGSFAWVQWRCLLVLTPRVIASPQVCAET